MTNKGIYAGLRRDNTERLPWRGSVGNIYIPPRRRYVGQVDTLAAPATCYLPPAFTVPAGDVIRIVDESNSVSATNYILVSVAPNSGDTIPNGLGSIWAFLISPGGAMWAMSNGIDQYTVVSAPTSVDPTTGLGTSNSVVPTQAAVKTYADTKVAKSTYDANSILKADSDDTPIVLTIGASTFVGRKSSGSIVAMTPAEARTELGVYQSIGAYKASDQTFTANSTALQDDSDLQVAVVASAIYRVELDVIYQVNDVADMKLAFAGPSGATMIWSMLNLTTSAVGSNSGNTVFQRSGAIGTSLAAAGNGATNTAGSSLCARVSGTLTVSSTAGTFKAQFAQANTDTGTATLKVLAGTNMVLTRLA